MPFDEFIAIHQLQDADEATKDWAYAQYLEQLNTALEQLEED